MPDAFLGPADKPLVDVDPMPPFCFGCGYDLTGLELPRQCPECGLLRDPSLDEQARKWFAGRWACLRWLRHPSRTPTNLCYLLFDRPSMHIARRRRFRWLWLPAILCSLVVAIGSFIVVEHDVKVWHYAKDDPQKKPRGVRNETEADRPYHLNLHFHFPVWEDIVLSPKTTWVTERERQGRRGVALAWPEVDFLAVVVGGLLWFGLLLGFLPTRLLLTRSIPRGMTGQHASEMRSAVRSVSSLVVPIFGASAWIWVGVVIVWGVDTVLPIPWIEGVEIYLALGATILWMVASLVGWPMLVMLDRDRIRFRHRVLTAVACLLLSAGGPVLAVWGIATF